MPYARVGIYKARSAALEQVIDKARRELVPATRAKPGFRRYVAARTGPDSVISLSTWDTKEQAEAAAQSLSSWVKENMADSLESVENHVGDVVVFAEASPEARGSHIRFAVVKIKPGMMDETIRKVETEFLPMLRSKPGFVRYGAIRAGENLGIAANGWETKAQAEAAAEASRSWVNQSLAPLVESVEYHVGEVLWAERAG